AATLCLLYAFPLLFLGSHDGTAALAARVIGWAFAIWGTALYWWAAALYLTQARQVIAGVRGSREPGQGQPPLARQRQPGDDGASREGRETARREGTGEGRWPRNPTAAADRR